MKEFIEAFKALRHASRAVWLVIFAFGLEATAYFGVLLLMKSFLAQDVGIRPEFATMWVSALTSGLTIIMLFVGKPVEARLGIRRGIIFALLLCSVGRVLYSGAPFVGGVVTLALSLVLVAVGEGILQPVAYAGVKKFTGADTRSMGFALLYAGMNLGIMISGPISAAVRTKFDVPYKAGLSKLSGFNAVNLVCVGVTLLTLAVFVMFMTKKAERDGTQSDSTTENGSTVGEAAGASGKKQAAGRSPFTDKKFLFFIFALLPVRTLFAHQWLTMPDYVLRTFPPEVTDRMEWLVGSLNPLIIVFGVPTITALTKRFHVLTMMITGSLVSAAATFLLVPGPNLGMLIGYFVVFSIGEALWSARFLEYAAELAPEGRVAQYMGVANIPWFVAKLTTGLYSGWILERFVPKEGPQRSGTMWLIYGVIAMASPIALILARKWVRTGMATKAEAPATAQAA